MNKTQNKLLLLILISNTVLFIFIAVTFNTVIVKHFINDAEKAITNEFKMMNSNESDTYNNPIYLSSNISYIYLDSQNNFISSGEDFENIMQYRKDFVSEKEEIKEIFTDNEIEDEVCCSFKTQNSYMVTARSSRYFQETGMILIMYINIQPFIKYAYSLNWIICVMYLGVSVVMCTIGKRTGARIDEAHEHERRFFQNSSHELKTPLMSIQGYAEGIMLNINEPEKAAKVIMTESNRMIKLVEELLCISKIDSPRYKLYKEKISICELIYDSAAIAQPLAEQKSCKIIVDHIDSVMIYCDEEQMIRAVSNIIVNAVYHCNTRVHVSCITEKNKIKLIIENDGNPIPEDILPHIFERFYTGHKGGSGIGLSLAKEVITLHNGTIEIKNRQACISCRITLPK